MNGSSEAEDAIIHLEVGQGIKSLLRQAYRITGNPILIHDMEYKVIALNENITTDDPIWIEYAETGTVGYHWLDFFKNECFLDKAANAKVITFLTSDKLAYNRIYGKIFNKNNIQIGCACMTACNRPFERDDPVVFEHICAAISRELGLVDFYNDYGQTYLEKLIGELIGGIRDRELYTAHIESIYIHLKTHLYLAVVDQGGTDYTLPQYRELFRQARPEYTYAVYGNHVLILIGIDNPRLDVDRDLDQLMQLFHEHGIRAGLSGCFDNLFELPRYYCQALDALHGGAEAAAPNIFLHEPPDNELDV